MRIHLELLGKYVHYASVCLYDIRAKGELSTLFMEQMFDRKKVPPFAW